MTQQSHCWTCVCREGKPYAKDTAAPHTHRSQDMETAKRPRTDEQIQKMWFTHAHTRMTCGDGGADALTTHLCIQSPPYTGSCVDPTSLSREEEPHASPLWAHPLLSSESRVHTGTAALRSEEVASVPDPKDRAGDGGETQASSTHAGPVLALLSRGPRVVPGQWE